MTTGEPTPGTRRRRTLRRLAGVLVVDAFRWAPRPMITVSVAMLLGSVAVTAYPLAFRLLLDGVLERSRAEIVAGVIVFAALMTLSWLLTAIASLNAMDLVEQMSVERTGRVTELLASISTLEPFDRSDVRSDIDQLAAGRRHLAAAPNVAVAAAAAALRVVVLVALLTTVSPWLDGCVVLAVAPMVAAARATRIASVTDDALAEVRRESTAIVSLLTDVGTASELRSYGLADRLLATYDRLQVTIVARRRRAARAVLLAQCVGWSVFAGGLALGMWFVIRLAVDAAISPGTAIMAMTLIQRSRTQLSAVTQTTGALGQVMTCARRLLRVEDLVESGNAVRARSAPPHSLRHGITLEQVGFRYHGATRDALAGVDLFLPAGSCVAILGANGSGKSTLVKLVTGLYRPTAGRLLADGQSVVDFSPQAWQRRCTAAFQDYSRFNLTLIESVNFPERDALDDVAHASRALAHAGAGALPSQLPPDGLHTRLGTTMTGGRSLSDGQWQQVALARANSRRRPLVAVLDEPASSLDPHAERTLYERYLGQARRSRAESGCVTLLVSHNVTSVRDADLIVTMRAGRVTEVGSHAELMARAGLYSAMYRTQSTGR